MTELVNVPTFLHALVTDSGDDQMLTAYRSPVVQDTDPCMDPVFDFLSGRCSDEIGTTTEDDDRMMFGEVIHTAYRIYSTCPANRAHNCQQERLTAPLRASLSY